MIPYQPGGKMLLVIMPGGSAGLMLITPFSFIMRVLHNKQALHSW